MTLEQIVSLVGSLGFPIVVAWYLLTQMKRAIDANTKANENIALVMTRICEKLGIPQA